MSFNEDDFLIWVWKRQILNKKIKGRFFFHFDIQEATFFSRRIFLEGLELQIHKILKKFLKIENLILKLLISC